MHLYLFSSIISVNDVEVPFSSLSKGKRLTACENGVLEGIFGPKRQKVTEDKR